MKAICFLSGDITRSGGTERVTLDIANSLVVKMNNYKIYILSLEQQSNSTFFKINPNIKTRSDVCKNV